MSFDILRRTALAATLTTAAQHLDTAAAILTPDPDDASKPKLAWGDDLGLFEHFDEAANALDAGRDGLSEIYTRRQAGPVMDALGSDVATLQSLRSAALAIEEGVALADRSRAPRLGASALKDITRAAKDARDAVALLVPPIRR